MLPVVATEFQFRNEGLTTVTIVSLTPLCDCMKAITSKTVVGPGESGAIRIEVPHKPSGSRVTKALRVMTDRGEATVLKLSLEATVQPASSTPASARATSAKAKARAGISTAVAEATISRAPAAVILRSHLLTWKLGAPLREQAIELSVAAGREVVLGKVISRDPSFSVRLEKGSSVGAHRLMVAPLNTGIPIEGRVELETLIDGQPKTYFVRTVIE